MLIDFSNKDLYNEVYIPLFHTKKRYIFMLWSAWSWKSVWEAQNEIMKSFIPGNRTLCIRKVWATLKDSVYQELLNIIERWDLKEHFEITKSPLYIKNKLTWSDFLFRWLDDREKIKSISKINRIWIEEATELSSEDLDQLDLRLRWINKNWFQIVCTFNPVDAEHWLNTEWWSKWEDEDVFLLHTTYKDNKRIWEATYKAMERLKERNIDYYKIYALWEWGTLKGLIYENWSLINDIPSWAKLLWYWLDFWFTNDPSALVGLYKFNWELIFDELLYQTWLNNNVLAKRIQELCEYQNHTIYADSSEPKSIEEISLYWINIAWVVKWKDSIKYWIDILKGHKIRITARSSFLQKEIRKYAWKVDRNWKSLNEPVGWEDHLMDAIRYAWIMFVSNPYKELEDWSDVIIL